MTAVAVAMAVAVCWAAAWAQDPSDLASPYVTVAPAIDGDLSEWTDAEFTRVTPDTGVFDAESGVARDPADLSFSFAVANDGAKATVHLLGFNVKDLQILSHEFTHQHTASFFSLDWRPTEADELRDKQGATIGLTGTLTVKPGLPLGPINQTIQLKTNVTEVDQLELDISGTVVSDISIVGPSQFVEKHSVLMFGVIERDQGAKTTLRILVKGPHRQDVKLIVKQIDPADVLKASLGEAREINAGVVRMYPLEIEVPPGSRLVNRMGSDQAKFGKIVLESTHPTVKEIPINVKFAVE